MRLLTLKVKVVLPEKLGFFGNGKELKFRTCKLQQNHRQFQQRRGTLFHGKQGGIGEGLFWKKVHWRKARVRGDESCPLAELQGSQFLTRDAVCIFPCWSLDGWFFLWKIVLLGSVRDNFPVLEWYGSLFQPLLIFTRSSLLVFLSSAKHVIQGCVANAWSNGRTWEDLRVSRGIWGSSWRSWWNRFWTSCREVDCCPLCPHPGSVATSTDPRGAWGNRCFLQGSVEGHPPFC